MHHYEVRVINNENKLTERMFETYNGLIGIRGEPGCWNLDQGECYPY